LGAWAALRGDREKALSLLLEAIDHGLDAKTSLAMEKDSDLKSIAKGPRFVAILADARRRAAAAPQKPN
jgi:hypothetical protein